MLFSTYSLLVIAYFIVWMAFFFYVAWLHFEQQHLSRGLENLQSKFSRANGDTIEN